MHADCRCYTVAQARERLLSVIGHHHGVPQEVMASF